MSHFSRGKNIRTDKMQCSVNCTVHTVCSDAVMWFMVLIWCNRNWSNFGMGRILRTEDEVCLFRR